MSRHHLGGTWRTVAEVPQVAKYAAGKRYKLESAGHTSIRIGVFKRAEFALTFSLQVDRNDGRRRSVAINGKRGLTFRNSKGGTAATLPIVRGPRISGAGLGIFDTDAETVFLNLSTYIALSIQSLCACA